MNRIRWTVLALATTLLLAPAAGATPRVESGAEPATTLTRLADWFASAWRVMTGADSTEDDRGAGIDPDGFITSPNGGASGESDSGAQDQCSGECGPEIDPNG